MTETRYKIRFWNWDNENECYVCDADTFRDYNAAKKGFDVAKVSSAIPYIQFLKEKIANGCVIDEEQLAERKMVGTTVFDTITKDAATLAEVLASLPVIEAPWDTEFQKRYCSKCLRADCDSESECPYQQERNNPAWWLALDAAGVEL